jgi:hypothetical protein
VASSPSVTYICNRGGHGEPSIILGSGGGAGAVGGAGVEEVADVGAADVVPSSSDPGRSSGKPLSRPLGRPSVLYRAVASGSLVELLKELRDVCEELASKLEEDLRRGRDGGGHDELRELCELRELGELRELVAALRSSPLTLLRLLPSTSVMRLLRSLENGPSRPCPGGSGVGRGRFGGGHQGVRQLPDPASSSTASASSKAAPATANADNLVGWELAERCFEQVRWYLSAVKFRIDCLADLVCEGLSRSMKCLYEVVERILDGLEDFVRGLYARRIAKWLVGLPPIRRVLDVMRRCVGSEVLSFKLRRWREVLNSIFEGLRGEVEGLLRREQGLVDEAMAMTLLSLSKAVGGG